MRGLLGHVTGCLLWVKLRNTQHEQMSSAFPPRTDVGSARPQNIARIFRDLPCRAGLKESSSSATALPACTSPVLEHEEPLPIRQAIKCSGVAGSSAQRRQATAR